MYRLKNKHSRHLNAPRADAVALLREQNLRGAALASVVAVLLSMALWVLAAVVFDRYFPWVSVVLGYFTGQAVRRYGRGIEWPYPAVAAGGTVIGSFVGAFAVALFLTGREFRIGALTLVEEISWHTISVFAERNFGVDGVIYMLFAAVLAAFYATRRLKRQEAIAIRRHREQKRG